MSPSFALNQIWEKSLESALRVTKLLEPEACSPCDTHLSLDKLGQGAETKYRPSQSRCARLRLQVTGVVSLGVQGFLMASLGIQGVLMASGAQQTC